MMPSQPDAFALRSGSTAPFANYALESQVREKKAWTAFLVSAVLNFIFVGGLLYFAGKIVVLPYVVSIQAGETVQAVGLIPTTFKVERDEGVVRFLLPIWLNNRRALTTDIVAWEAQLLQAKAFETVQAQGMLKGFEQAQRERMKLGRAVQIEVLNLQPLAGTNNRTWEVDWAELTVSVEGYPIDAESGRWHATIKIGQLPSKPLVTKQDYANPLRLYIEEPLWQQRTKG